MSLLNRRQFLETTSAAGLASTLVPTSLDDHPTPWYDQAAIADLTGIPESVIRCDIEVGRVPGGPPSLR